MEERRARTGIPSAADVTKSAEQIDWFRQEPGRAAADDIADPVRTVWQLPRFRLGSRRFTGRIDCALVCVTRTAEYETFMPPARPASVRRYVTLYEVDTDPHSFRLDVLLPSLDDSFEFEAAIDVTWRVTGPDLFVQSQERDAPGFLSRALLPVMRSSTRAHPIDASADAEQSVQQALNSSPVGEREGIRVTCSIRLRRDVTERFHRARLRSARHEAEAAGPEHHAALQRDEYEAMRKANRIKFYEDCLARGGVAALALHLAVHQEDTQLVLSRLGDEQAKLVQTQLHLIDRALDGKRLEDHLLEVPHQLAAERMSDFLSGPSVADEVSAPHEQELPPGPELGA